MILKFFIVSILVIIPMCFTEVYLSDNDKRYKCIEDIQHYYSEQNIFLNSIPEGYYTKTSAYRQFLKESSRKTTFSFSGDSAVFSEMFKEYIPGDYPTRYQDPFTYLIYAPLVLEIQKAGETIFPKLHFTPKYGTLYINKINAERWPCAEDYVFLINVKIPTFCHQMGKVALQPFSTIRTENGMMTIDMDSTMLANKIKSNSEIGVNLLYTFLEFKLNKFPINNVLSLNDSYFEKALQYRNSSGETFVLAHEYAHGLLRHKNLSEKNSESQLKMWYDEINADILGQRILSEITFKKKNDPYYQGWIKYLLMGGYSFLTCLEIFEKQDYVYTNLEDYPFITSEEELIMFNILSNPSRKQNVEQFNKLSPKIRNLPYPPTKIRKAILKRELDQILRQNIYDNEQVNLVEDFHHQLAEMSNFSMNLMYASYSFDKTKLKDVKDSLENIYNAK